MQSEWFVFSLARHRGPETTGHLQRMNRSTVVFYRTTFHNHARTIQKNAMRNIIKWRFWAKKGIKYTFFFCVTRHLRALFNACNEKEGGGGVHGTIMENQCSCFSISVPPCGGTSDQARGPHIMTTTPSLLSNTVDTIVANKTLRIQQYSSATFYLSSFTTHKKDVINKPISFKKIESTIDLH